MTTSPVVARWSTFVRERYQPSTHLVMAASFALGNAAVAASAGGAPARPAAIGGAVALAFVFFLRLRVLDEIKDHDVDRDAHPERPLARGLVTPLEARNVAWLLALTELGIVALVEPRAVLAWAVLFVYSLGMFAEFGIGPWLRPRLELYALTHTLVAACLGLVVASMATGLPIQSLPAPIWIFALANWAVFNVFEFSRKSFAPVEERESVPSYSGRLGVPGAVALSLACVALALGSGWLTASPGMAVSAGAGAAVLGLGAVVVAVPYAAAPTSRTAALFRSGMGAWAVLFYAALATAHFVGMK